MQEKPSSSEQRTPCIGTVCDQEIWTRLLKKIYFKIHRNDLFLIKKSLNAKCKIKGQEYLFLGNLKYVFSCDQISGTHRITRYLNDKLRFYDYTHLVRK